MNSVGLVLMVLGLLIESHCTGAWSSMRRGIGITLVIIGLLAALIGLFTSTWQGADLVVSASIVVWFLDLLWLFARRNKSPHSTASVAGAGIAVFAVAAGLIASLYRNLP